MKRETALEEMVMAVIMGGIVTMIVFAFIHQDMNPGEVMAFWTGIWTVATYASWSIIIWAKRCRDAWQCNHGEKQR